MTNREWLNDLTDEQFRDWLLKDLEKLKFVYDNTYLGVLHWLKTEHRDKSSYGGEFIYNEKGEWVGVIYD